MSAPDKDTVVSKGRVQRKWGKPLKRCERLECGDTHTVTLHHEGCDGHFCYHGICQECGTTVADD